MVFITRQLIRLSNATVQLNLHKALPILTSTHLLQTGLGKMCFTTWQHEITTLAQISACNSQSTCVATRSNQTVRMTSGIQVSILKTQERNATMETISMEMVAHQTAKLKIHGSAWTIQATTYGATIAADRNVGTALLIRLTSIQMASQCSLRSVI